MAPAARLSTPTKSPSPGWPETNCTTRTPRSRSRPVASRTCGDSGAISATPSSASGWIADEEARDPVRLLAHHPAAAHLDELLGEGLARLVDMGDHRVEELVALPRQQELEAVGAPAGQVGGGEVAHEAEALDRLVDRVDGRLAHAGAPVEHAVDRREADPRRAGEILGGRAHSLVGLRFRSAYILSFAGRLQRF